MHLSGLYNEANCNPRFINHAVLVVGYGTDRGQDFWLVKNRYICVLWLQVFSCKRHYPTCEKKCMTPRVWPILNVKCECLCDSSWGTAWGEQGFIRIARNKKNLCGVASFAVYPTVWKWDRSPESNLGHFIYLFTIRHQMFVVFIINNKTTDIVLKNTVLKKSFISQICFGSHSHSCFDSVWLTSKLLSFILWLKENDWKKLSVIVYIM